MEVEKKALIFANYAHFGQKRKAEIEKPYIVHPVHVASLLIEYGFDSEVISAGFLHDVVEDTNYRQSDIETYFGCNISSLVEKATQANKKMSWEERKLESIQEIKYQDLQHKAVVVADKITNLDDIRILFGKKGRYDFSAFRRGYDKQKWYYEEMYKSLTFGGYENHPMFLHLGRLIDEVFHSNRSFYYSNLEYKKQELIKLKRILKTLKLYGDISSFSFPYLGFDIEKRRNKVLNQIDDVSEKIQKLRFSKNI